MKLGINKTINRHWRDWAGLVYLFICLIDFFVAPLIWNLKMEAYCYDIKMTALEKGLDSSDCDITRWTPLTLGAGAMFHLSFGAILGATAWKKKEELEAHNNNNSTTG